VRAVRAIRVRLPRPHQQRRCEGEHMHEMIALMIKVETVRRLLHELNQKAPSQRHSHHMRSEPDLAHATLSYM
jgi:hypothetical protein